MKIGEFELEPPARPLNNPHCIAFLNPWVNSGNVGEHAFKRIRSIYRAKRIGALREPGMFYDFTRYRPRLTHIQGRRNYRLPNTIIFAGRPPEDSKAENDLVLLYMLEPHAFGERFNSTVISVLRELGISRYTLAGGMYDLVPHTRTLPVSAAVSNWEIPPGLKQAGAIPPTYEGPTSVASLISHRLATDDGMETMSLIVHLPLYHRPTNHYMGSTRLLDALSQVYSPIAPQANDRSHAQRTERKIDEEAQGNDRLMHLVKQLEDKYDRSSLGAAPQEGPELSPEIEKFLRDITEETSDGGGGEHPPPSGI